MGEIHGIDVSHYQGNINWPAVYAAGKRFAVLKCQYESAGHGYDPTFKYNFENAADAGLMVNVYDYFGSVTYADPVGQATALLTKLKAAGYEGTIWMDHENSKLKNIGKVATNNMIARYVAPLKAAGYELGIYCNRDWYVNVLDTSNLKKIYPFWIARFPSNDTGIYNASSSLNPKSYGDAWQFSSKGKVSGITGNVDLDVDFDGIVNFTNSHIPSTVPTFVKGKNYTLQADMNVRSSANGSKLPYSKLTTNGKENATMNSDGTAVLNRGTVVTVQEISILSNNSVWVRIPSGWICGYGSDGVTYVK